MKMASRTIVILLSICYLGMSSLALAHIPQMADNSDLSQDPHLMTGDMEQPDCHTVSDMAMNHEAFSLCQIFCSAIGHAVETDIPALVATISSPILDSSNTYHLDSRHIQVEPHPPK